MTEPPRRWQALATIAVVALSAASSLFGLLRPGHYNDPVAMLPRIFAQDLSILLVGVPALAIGLRFALVGSLRGRLLWLGALAYATYTWASVGLTTAFNRLFLVYVALFALSLFALVGATADTDASAVKRSLEGNVSVRTYGGFLALVSAGLGLLWLSEVAPAILSDTAPAAVQELGPQSLGTLVLDLGVVVPALAVAAVWLRRRRAWGYVLAGVLLVFGGLLAPAITAMTVVDLLGDAVTVTVPLLVGSVVPPVVSAAFAARYLLAVDAGRTSEAGEGADPAG